MVFFLNLTNTTTYLYVQKSGSLAKNEIIQFRLKWNVNLEFLQIPHGVIFFFFSCLVFIWCAELHQLNYWRCCPTCLDFKWQCRGNKSFIRYCTFPIETNIFSSLRAKHAKRESNLVRNQKELSTGQVPFSQKKFLVPQILFKNP